MINEAKVKKYCSEDLSKIENYEQAVNDNTQIWHCHHRREIDENKSRSQLIAEKLYYCRPAAELIFLSKSEHSKLHGHSEETRKKLLEIVKNRAPMSEETRKKLSIALSGEKHHMFGKHLSAETRKKISIAHKGKVTLCGEKHYMFGKHHSEETKKKMSMSLSGKSPWNKGKQLSAETKKKQADAFKGTHWWNNGLVSKQKRECPGEGWVRGRLKCNKHK